VAPAHVEPVSESVTLQLGHADVGRCQISGPLLRELEQLKKGEVLRLTAKDGRSYMVTVWPEFESQERQAI